MLNFKYEIKTQDGDIQKGKIIASSQNNAILLLKKQGYHILSITEEKKSILTYELSWGVSKKDIIIFTKQLSIMLDSKIALIESLGIILPEIKNKKFQKIIIDIIEKIKAGSTFSDALKNHPKTFSEFYIGLIKTGETSGTLADSLLYLSKHIEEQAKFKSKLISAMIYPLFILSVMLIIIGALFLYILPVKLFPILEGMGEKDLPFITTIVMGFVDILKTNIIIIISTILILIIGFIATYKTKKGRYFFDKNILKIPLFGDIIKKIYMVQFIKNFTVSVSSGLPIIKALNIAAFVMSNRAYRKALQDVSTKASAGGELSSIIRQHSSLFSGFLIQMLMVGEKTGMLKNSLTGVAKIYEEEINSKINMIISLLEPLMMIFLGAVVLVIVLAVFLPILQMTAM